MISQLHFDRERVQDIMSTLDTYPSDEFKSPFRSTVPLLSMVQDAPSVFSAIFAACQMREPVSVHLEYTVAPPRGIGKPSHTDVMARAGDEALAIEAKWSEPRYETVGDWLKQGKNKDNRQHVMAGWLELLKPHATRQLNVDDFHDAIYQMVHRAASACSMTKHPRLAYLHFTPPPDARAAMSDHYSTDLTHLHGLLGRTVGFPFYLVEVRATRTPAFETIAGLAKGSAETSKPVRRALRKGGLFAFTLHHVQSIP